MMFKNTDLRLTWWKRCAGAAPLAGSGLVACARDVGTRGTAHSLGTRQARRTRVQAPRGQEGGGRKAARGMRMPHGMKAEEADGEAEERTKRWADAEPFGELENVKMKSAGGAKSV